MTIKNVLSLDGGGIRGLITAIWLVEIERRLRRAGKGGVRDHFDLIAGTSTGSIIACGLAHGFSPQQLVDLYLNRRHEIFPGRGSRLWSRVNRFISQGPSAPKYDGEGLREVLSSEFGDVRLRQLSPITMVVSYDTISRSPVMFKSHKQEHLDLKVKDVCVASSSAPTYFPGHLMNVEGQDCALIDGGVVANNPTACAVAEALRLNRERGAGDVSMTVVSIGTGQVSREISARETQEWGALEWAIPIIDVLFDGASKANDYIVRQTFGNGYYRLQTTLGKGLDDLDDVTGANITALTETAQKYLRESKTQQMLDEIASRL